MIFKELTVLTNTLGSELVANILCELGSEGASIYDSNDLINVLQSDVIWDYVEEHLLTKNEVVTVKGYYPTENFDSIYNAVINRLQDLKSLSEDNLGSLEVSQKEIDDEDWLNVWKKYYSPIHIGKIVILPIWLKYEPIGEEKIVLMNPGMAFGTGEHESTKICLTLFNELDCAEKDVLDIGTGSGILGITAGVLGAKSVFMSDIDEIAVDSARKNAENNNITCPFKIEKLDLVNDKNIKGDIVFANITADILIKLSKNIKNCLNYNGYIIVSGIILSRRSDVLNAFLSQGFNLDKSMEMGEWCGFRFKNI